MSKLLSDEYCEGFCVDGGKGKFIDDCTGCQIALLEAEMAAMRELLTLIRDDLRMRSENGVVDISVIWMRIDKVLQEKGE